MRQNISSDINDHQGRDERDEKLTGNEEII